MKTTDEKLNDARVYLISKNMFYGMIVSQLKFKKTSSCPSMGITPHLHLVYNPEFIDKLNVKQLAACLEHETWHLVLGHMTRFAWGERESMLNNLACDLAINQHIQNLPDFVAQIRQFWYKDSSGQDQQFPANETAEKYKELLKQGAEPLSCNGKCSECGNGQPQDSDGDKQGEGCSKQFDDHDNWGDPGFEGEKFQSEFKSVLKNAKEITEKTAGSLSQDMQQILDDWFKPPKVPWQKILKRKIAQGTLPSTDLTLTNYRESNRFNGMPGTKKLTESKDVIFSVDCSGSMSDELLKQAYSEMKSLHKKGFRVWVIQWDTEPTEPEKFKPSLQIEIKKRGGTDVIPTIEMVEQRFPGDYFHICFSDGHWFKYPEEINTRHHFFVLTDHNGYEAFTSRYGDRNVMLVNEKDL